MRRITLRTEDVGQGDLMLVNHAHPVEQEREEGFASIHPGFPAIRMKSPAAERLTALLYRLDCLEQIVPVSGYRPREEQEAIYADSLKVNGSEFTRQFVALPGCSEHQTGLAIDLAENRPNIDFIRPDFPDTGICGEFRKLASAYGFVERYRQGKEAITGIAWEPWHFRYVGAPHAYVIEQSGMALEEYVELLGHFSQDKPFCLTVYGREYQIFTVPVQGSAPTFVQIPDNASVHISGNNRSGVVLTLW